MFVVAIRFELMELLTVRRSEALVPNVVFLPTAILPENTEVAVVEVASTYGPAIYCPPSMIEAWIPPPNVDVAPSLRIVVGCEVPIAMVDGSDSVTPPEPLSVTVS